MATEWDASTISAVVALVISVFALVVTGAQALQQYYITEQLIRLCDSVVFGPLPGQGRRIWQPSQFRFRLVYSIPQTSLQACGRRRARIPSLMRSGRIPFLTSTKLSVPGPRKNS